MKLFQRHKLFLVVCYMCLWFTTAHADPITATALIVAAVSTAASVGLGILAQYLAPKPKPVEINKQNPSVQTSEYGQVVPRLYGLHNFNIAGQVIDYFPLTFKETPKVTPGQGGKHKTPSTTTYSYSATVAVMVCAGPIKGIRRITADTTTLYTGTPTGDDVSATPAGMTGLKIYVGKETQDPDPYFVAEHGSGNVPAYRGLAYVVFYDLNLDPFYTRIPNITFEVEATDGTLSEICASELELVGLTSDEYDVSELESDTVDGLWIAQRGSVRSVSLEPLSLAKQFDFVEIDGKLKAFKRPRTSEVTVPLSDLGAYDYDQSGQPNSEKPARTKSARTQNADLYSGVDVVYFDKGRNGEKNTQPADRQFAETVNRKALTFAMTMTANEASRIAKVELAKEWNERTPFEFSLPPKYLRFTNGTVMTIPTVNGDTFDVRVEKMEFGIPGVVNCQAVTQLAEAYAQIGEGDVGQSGSGDLTGGYGSTGVTVPGVLVAADVKVMFSTVDGLLAAHKGLQGFYAWVTRDPADTRPEAIWQGAIIRRDLDGDGTYQVYGTMYSRGIFGTAASALADFSTADGIDSTNYVDVDLIDNSTLETISNEAFDGSRVLNVIVLGVEKLQFRDVTQPDVSGHPKRWRLSHLRRGMDASVMTGHAIAEDFGLVDSSVSFFQTAFGETGSIVIDYTPPDVGGGGGGGGGTKYVELPY